MTLARHCHRMTQRHGCCPQFSDAFHALVVGREGPYRNGIRSTLAQAASIAFAGAGERWRGQDEETMLAQGRASAMAGRFLATEVVPYLDGLSTRFAQGGAFLDVGVGVGELASAFCSDLPGVRVVGLDPFPLALELARKTIEDRGLVDRIELRPHGVEEPERAPPRRWLRRRERARRSTGRTTDLRDQAATPRRRRTHDAGL